MLINNEFTEEKIQSPWQYAWSIFKRKNIAVTAMWASVLLIIITLSADFIVPHDASAQYVKVLLLPPYWMEGGSSTHILGTDDLGRDCLARLIQGAKFTLGGALLITLAISILGTIIGATAALTKGLKASILHHLLDTLLIIPTLLTALILIVMFGASYENSLIAVSLSLLPQFIRGIFLSIENELNKQYIIALRLDGATNLRILRCGILPNIIEPIITLLSRIFTMAILEISTLGFLGFGTQHDNVELGALIANSTDLIYSSPWLVFFPGLVIFIIISVFYIFTEGLRHAVLEGEEE